jgi:hypothetical protein
MDHPIVPMSFMYFALGVVIVVASVVGWMRERAKARRELDNKVKPRRA